jgi:uncharacterized membrane protein
MDKKIGSYAFLAGIAIAVLAGLGFEKPIFVPVLVVLGLIVGFLNVTQKKTVNFLVAAIALMVAGASVGAITLLGGIVQRTLVSIAIFVAPAAVVVALQDIYALAKD